MYRTQKHTYTELEEIKIKFMEEKKNISSDM